jgi:hypothetical protein
MSNEEMFDQGTTGQPHSPHCRPLVPGDKEDQQRSQKPAFLTYNSKNPPSKSKNTSISPSPPSKIIRLSENAAQVGQIFVIENDELDYRMATTLNKKILKRVDPGPGSSVKWHVCDWVQAYKEFRRFYGDDYDFVAMVPDIQLDTSNKPTADSMRNFVAHHIHVFNNVAGINYDYGDYYDIGSYFGSTRLQGIAALPPMLASSRMTRLHEIGHRWGAYVWFKKGPSDQSDHHDLLKHDEFNREFHHWSDNFDSGLSSMADMLGTNWIDRHDGTFTKVSYYDNDQPFSYCPLDLYLMGMFAPAEVGNFFYVANLKELDNNLALFSGTRVDLRVENIVWAHGPRQPHAAHSQRSFRLACVVLTKDLDSGIRAAEVLQEYRRSVTEQFREATQSRAMLDTLLYDSSYDGVYIRHHDLDMGIEPSRGVFWNSPDIWVRNKEDGHEHTAHQAIRLNEDNWIYIRVRNNGCRQPCGEISVNVFQAEPGTEFLYPQDWEWNDAHLIGSQQVGPMPPGGERLVKMKWKWEKISQLLRRNMGQPCLLVELLPTHPTLTKLRYVWEDRRIAQRNLIILSPAPGTTELSFEFLIGAHSLPKRSVHIRVQQQGDSCLDQVILDLGEQTEESLPKISGGHLTELDGGVAFIIDHPQEGGNVTLPLLEAEQKRLALRVKWDEASPPTNVRFTITQLNEQYEVVGGLDLLIQDGRSNHN